jgi:hypothetical protein
MVPLLRRQLGQQARDRVALLLDDLPAALTVEDCRSGGHEGTSDIIGQAI